MKKQQQPKLEHKKSELRKACDKWKEAEDECQKIYDKTKILNMQLKEAETRREKALYECVKALEKKKQ